MKRVCIILGTRPEAIKLAPVIQTFQNYQGLETQVILTGQHREMVEQVMGLFDLTASRDLEIMQPKQSLSDITCRSLRGLQDLFEESEPNLVLAQGDTTTAFAAALAAFYKKI
ncbi:MAG: UDP-N-acetylglucosamine 2-epimerase, partial [Cyanobacteria bacterium J06649_11]